MSGGIIGHEESAQGLRDGKSDPGPQFDYDRLFREVEGEDMHMKLIRIQGHREVYVSNGSTLQHIPGGQYATATYGPGWRADVVDVETDDVLLDLPVTYPDGVPDDMRDQ